MQHLREVNGEEKQITLNGKPTTLQEIEKKKADKSLRIVEQSPGQWKTLQKLKG